MIKTIVGYNSKWHNSSWYNFIWYLIECFSMSAPRFASLDRLTRIAFVVYRYDLYVFVCFYYYDDCSLYSNFVQTLLDPLYSLLVSHHDYSTCLYIYQHIVPIAPSVSPINSNSLQIRPSKTDRYRHSTDAPW